jgi:hypothetical protein
VSKNFAYKKANPMEHIHAGEAGSRSAVREFPKVYYRVRKNPSLDLSCVTCTQCTDSPTLL